MSKGSGKVATELFQARLFILNRPIPVCHCTDITFKLSFTSRRLPLAYVRCASFSDCWQAYADSFDPQRHRMVSKDEGQTNHVARWFNTLRQRLARFTRRTPAFSKRDDLYDGLLRMFIYDYNLSCIR
jgi:IS1 family transposase